MFGVNSLISRALVHTARLFWAVKPIDKQIGRLEQQMRDHLDRQPCRVRASGIFYREAMSVLRHTPGAASSAKVTLEQSQQRLVHAQKKFKTVPARLVSRCEELAKIEACKKEQERYEKLLKLSRELATLKFKKKCELWKDLPPKLSFATAAFSKEQEDRLDAVLNGPTMSQTRVTELRKMAVQHSMLSNAEFKVLDAQQLVDAPLDRRPWWLSAVVTCREAFAGTALRFGKDSQSYFKFLYAKQQPHLVTFAPLQIQEKYTPLFPGPSSSGEDICSPLCGWQFNFRCDRLAIKMAHEVDDQPESEVYVLTGIMEMGSELVADGPEYNLAQFLAGLQQHKKVRQEQQPSEKKMGGAGAKAEEWAAMVAKYPWLAESATSRPAKRSRLPAGAASSAHCEAEGDDGADEEEDVDAGGAAGLELDDETVEAIFAELDSKREEWSRVYGDKELTDFKTGLLGGAGTFKEVGAVADFVCCEASTRQAKAFVKKYGLRASKRCSLTAYDSVHNSTVLVQGWGHRMQHYLDLYRCSGDEMYTFTVADHNRYVETDEFREMAARGGKFLDVVQSIRSVMPFFASSD